MAPRAGIKSMQELAGRECTERGLSTVDVELRHSKEGEAPMVCGRVIEGTDGQTFACKPNRLGRSWT